MKQFDTLMLKHHLKSLDFHINLTLDREKYEEHFQWFRTNNLKVRFNKNKREHELLNPNTQQPA